MANYLSARVLSIAAIDELDQAAIDGNAGPVTGPIVKLSAQLAAVGTITQAQYDAVVVARDAALQQVTTVTGERDARQAAIVAMKAAAQIDLTNDAANVAGQGVLTAAGSF